MYRICSIKRRPRLNTADGSKATNKHRPRTALKAFTRENKKKLCPT